MLCVLAVPGVTDDHAGKLRKLLTADEARAWQAVGRLNIGRSSFCTGCVGCWVLRVKPLSVSICKNR